MSYKVAAFYQFVTLPDFRGLREPLRNMCVALDIKGIILPRRRRASTGPWPAAEVAIDALIEPVTERCLVQTGASTIWN